MKFKQGTLSLKRDTLFLRLIVAGMGLVPAAFFVFTVDDTIYGDLDGYTYIALGMYLSSLPFWYALYQALVLLKNIDEQTTFSKSSAVALGKIRACALVIAGIYTLLLPLLFNLADTDDAPGVFAIGLILVVASLSVAAFAAVLQRLLYQAKDINN